MTFVLAYNPTDGPVVIDAAGRIIGGQEWGAADTSDELTSAAVDLGHLVLPDEPGKGSTPAALHAHRQAQALSDRQAAFAAADKPRLRELAADLLDEDADPSKTELVTLLVHSSIDTPSAALKPAPKE